METRRCLRFVAIWRVSFFVESSAEQLDSSYLKVEKSFVVDQSPPEETLVHLLGWQEKVKHSTERSEYFTCSTANHWYLSIGSGAKCGSCARVMTQSIQPDQGYAVNGSRPTRVLHAIAGSYGTGCGYNMNNYFTIVDNRANYLGGFVKEALTFMVTDGLEFYPSSTIKSINLLNTQGVKSMADLESCETTVTKDHALALVQAALTSSTSLNDVFGSLIVNRKKVGTSPRSPPGPAAPAPPVPPKAKAPVPPAPAVPPAPPVPAAPIAPPAPPALAVPPAPAAPAPPAPVVPPAPPVAPLAPAVPPAPAAPAPPARAVPPVPPLPVAPVAPPTRTAPSALAAPAPPVRPLPRPAAPAPPVSPALAPLAPPAPPAPALPPGLVNPAPPAPVAPLGIVAPAPPAPAALLVPPAPAAPPAPAVPPVPPAPAVPPRLAAPAPARPYPPPPGLPRQRSTHKSPTARASQVGQAAVAVQLQDLQQDHPLLHRH
ncbi:unnamed protein product [Closterium sp. NIES-53]